MTNPRTAPDPVAQASATASSANVETLPRGRLGRATLTSNSTGTLTTEVIMTRTVTVGTNRTVDIDVSVMVRSDIAGGAQCALLEDGTQIQRKNVSTLGPGVDQSWSFKIESQPAVGSHTYEVVTGVSGGAGNKVTAIANGATGTEGVGTLYITDVGPAY